MDSELSRLIRRATFCLVALGAAATEIAAVEVRPVASSLLIAGGWVGLAVIIALFAKRPGAGRNIPPRSVFFVLLALTAAPFVIEPLRRGVTGEGFPQELQMLFALRNLGLGLAAFAVWPICLHAACVVSLFLMLFGLCLTANPAVLWLLGLYCASGSTWLILVNWSGLRTSVPTSGVSVRVEARVRRLPWFAAVLVLSVVGCAVAVLAVGPRRTLGSLGEWLQTSGGTGGYDPFSRGGLNDGDEETRGNNPLSTGMIETDQFLDSPLPALYDIANDMYGEPFKPEGQERAIPLDSRQLKLHESTKPPPDNKRPSREFPTARRGPKEPRTPSDRSARALFEIEGRTPMHVRAVAFDSFDGANWREAPLNAGVCMIQKELASCWMRVEESNPEPIFARPEQHKFKIAEGIGSLIPTPPYPVRFRVGRVDRASFFAWGQEHILRFAERKTPSGIVIETESRVLDPRLLGKLTLYRHQLDDDPQRLSLPGNLHPDVLALANTWAGSESHGWAQVSAIVDHLRTEYELDPSAHTPDGRTEPLADFLLVAHRGPDYQFASAAAVLLRVLGYPTRMVSGFYASPEQFDTETKHTPVVKEDLHFWTELRLPSGTWIVIEPTPGYEVLGPRMSWLERMSASLLGLGRWLGRHGIVLAMCFLAVAALWWQRIGVADQTIAVLLRLFPGRTWDRRVRRVLWLMERRGGWAGRPRPTSQTPAKWLKTVLARRGEQETDLLTLLTMAEWSAYAQGLSPSWRLTDVENMRRGILEKWTLRRWRQVVAFASVRGEGS